MKGLAEQSRNAGELKAHTRRMEAFLNDIKSRINNVVTSSDEAIPMKANLISRVESRQGTLAEVTAEIDYFDRLAAMETELNEVIQEYAEKLPQSETELSTDEMAVIISTIEQKVIPRLRDLRARADQNAPRSEQAAKAWSTLINELDTKLAASEIILSSFQKKAASSRAAVADDRLGRKHKNRSN